MKEVYSTITHHHLLWTVHELAYLNKYLLKYKYRFLLASIFIAGNHIFSIIPARLIKHVFDFIKTMFDLYGTNLLSQGTHQPAYTMFFKELFFYIGLILVLAFLKFICAFFMRQVIMSVANKIEYELKNEIYNHYQSLPLSFYTKSNTGHLMALLTEDVSKVKLYFGQSIFFVLSSAGLFLILIPYMLSINPRLTFYAILPLPILFIGIYHIKDFLYKRSEQLQAKLATLTTKAQETFAGIRAVQAFAREKSFTHHFSQEAGAYKQAAIHLAAVNAITTPLAIGINSLSIILIVWVGRQEIIKGTITVGNIAEFIMYMHLLTWPMITISLVTNYVQRAAASQKRINQLLAERNLIISVKNLMTPIKGSITFESTTFTYADTAIKSLNNLSFSVEAGESVLILGSTGSGKSTIANLLTRFYQPQQGRILIDGVPIEDYNIDWLREQIGYVPQDILLFPDTIRNNITFGNKEATPAEIEQALRYAGLYTTVQYLPHQLDTLVRERGVTLSGGQKQRIALARAFIRNPRILILDNALSAVDAHTAKSILNHLKTLMPGRTTLMISHVIPPLHWINKVIVLHQGSIVEQGSPETLLAAKGLYYQAYIKQQG